MKYDDKQLQMREYLVAKRKMIRRCEAAKQWNDYALQSGGGVVIRRPDRGAGQDIGAIKAMAMSIEAEARHLAEEVEGLRRQLHDSIALMPTPKYRDVLEAMYLLGKSRTEIAEEYSCEPRTVGRWLRLATEELDSSSNFFREHANT